MQGFQDIFVSALLCLVSACVIAKFVSLIFYEGHHSDTMVKFDANKVVKVVEKVNLGNAFKVRESTSKKRVKFVDQLEFGKGGHEIGQKTKSVVLSGEEGVILEGKKDKYEIFKCFDEEKVNEDGEIFPYSDGLDKGMSDEASEREIIAYFDQHLSLEEENVIIRGNIEKVEILKGMEDLTIEEKVIKEETSTSGSVLEGLMVDEKMNNEGFSSPGECPTLDPKEDNLVERLGENVEGSLSKKDDYRETKNENVVIDEEDGDWEGIERTDLEKVFAKAVNFFEFGLKGKDELAKLGIDVQMQLYGLHKIAVEGSCHQAQPMALNFFARAKWNAWQKLGSINPEVAMEEYIQLLTGHFPRWLQHFYGEDRGIYRDADHRSSLQDDEPNFLQGPELKLDCVSEIEALTWTKTEEN